MLAWHIEDTMGSEDERQENRQCRTGGHQGKGTEEKDQGKQGVKQLGEGELEKNKRLKDRKQRSGYSFCEQGDEETANKPSPCKQL